MRTSLDRLEPGQRGRVLALGLLPGERESLSRLGLIPGTELRCVCRSPLGDPSAYLICGAAIALRRSDSCRIEVEVEPWNAS